MSLAVPVSSTQVVVRFLTPPPHVLLHAPYSPTCSERLWLERVMMMQDCMSCACPACLICPHKLHAIKHMTSRAAVYAHSLLSPYIL